ncbi:precorrin-3B C(17)-methyltransferase [Synechococcus elongatus]|uniref:Precorrin-3B C(17)-methyltransferase n=1 Tax=Synechococcus elongatus PCC 11801 TaxID=2219813 RepID=A0AAN1QN82_SYNEL|nr:precorrin-3B C(17)-methyltransferase [Synechococcus elongatus]AZB72476.1 precorrin-3B C(17)-methyltransferase [Synechococcus elongatus PCC 11801]
MTAIAIVILGETSYITAARIQSALPDSIIYGLQQRTQSADQTYRDFGETVRTLFQQGQTIIGICSAGILIRSLAAVLNNKWQEPAVLAIAEDGSSVVPLLGSLQGANQLAQQLAQVFKSHAAITTTGSIRFQTTLLSPPNGYQLAFPETAKTFIADLLSGQSVKLEGTATWLETAKLSLDAQARHCIKVTHQLQQPDPYQLTYYSKTVAIFIALKNFSGDSDIAYIIQTQLTAHQIAPASIALIGLLVNQTQSVDIQTIATQFSVPIRLVRNSSTQSVSDLAKQLTHAEQIIAVDSVITIAIAEQPLDSDAIGQAAGQLSIVGLGPGAAEWLTPQARQALQQATDWIGYKTYLNLAEPWRSPRTQRHDSDNRVELDRARHALDLAATGRKVAVISSGDPGIYAMAAAVFEVLEKAENPDWQTLDIRICPGISAMQAAAAQVGAPLGHDFCTISLSDILKPWEIIAERITAAAQADFAIAFYNPVSKSRRWQLEKARDLLLAWRSPQTPVLLARNLGRPQQSMQVIALADLVADLVDMNTVVLIGSSRTRQFEAASRSWIYTPRYY